MPRTLNSVKHHPSSDLQPYRRAPSDIETATAPSSRSSPELRYGSSDESIADDSTAATSSWLAPLQTHGLLDHPDQLETVGGDDPRSFDLLAAPPDDSKGSYQIEDRADRLFSMDHLRQIFADPRLLLHFTDFLHSHRPRSLRILTYYLDTLKAIRAIEYANAITNSLDPLHSHEFTKVVPPSTVNEALKERAQKAFESLTRDELPAYIAYTWIQVVSESMQKRVTGTLAPHLREASEGLAEVFCLSDPSRPDNPIVFASEGVYLSWQNLSMYRC
ncbi:hypothetical protein ANO11243_013670 [Dothideomycetidae sp. 11243]|nr:hypothetical protein ANO11243_013670 [fungal sp. No.11243]